MGEKQFLIKNIFFASSAAFGVASAYVPALAIPCALTGLAGNVTDEISEFTRNLYEKIR